MNDKCSSNYENALKCLYIETIRSVSFSTIKTKFTQIDLISEQQNKISVDKPSIETKYFKDAYEKRKNFYENKK